MPTIAKRLEILEASTVADALSHWELCLVLSLTEPSSQTYALNKLTGEKSYEPALLHDLSSRKKGVGSVVLSIPELTDEEALAMEELGYVLRE